MLYRRESSCIIDCSAQYQPLLWRREQERDMGDVWETLAAVPASRSRAVPGFSAARLRDMRCTRAMLTQKELADLAGISRGAVSHLEQGRRQPMVTTLRGLCIALGCDPGDLMEGTEKDDTTSQDEAEDIRSRAAV